MKVHILFSSMTQTTYELFFLTIALIILSAALWVSHSTSTIHSLISLIVSFLASSIFLFALEAEFFALLFLIIYVGAIAVLFLFVLMLLDLKVSPRNNSINIKYIVFGIFIGLNFFYFVTQTFKDYYESNPYEGTVLIPHIHTNYFTEDDTSEIIVIGQILYTQYVVQFLIAGVLLSLAVIGVCVLTLNPQIIAKNSLSPIVTNFQNRSW